MLTSGASGMDHIGLHSQEAHSLMGRHCFLSFQALVLTAAAPEGWQGPGLLPLHHQGAGPLEIAKAH